MTVADVKKGIETQQDLVKVGLTVNAQQELLKASNKYGTRERILSVIDAVISVDEVTLRRIQEEEKVKELLEIQTRFETEISRLGADVVHLKADVAFAKVLREKHHFDQSSMDELQRLAEKHGTVTGVIGALNAYTDLKRIEGVLAEAEARRKTVESEISILKGERDQSQSTINTLNQSLGAMEQLTRSSRQIMILAELILRPREARADDYEIARLCVALLSGAQERAAHLSMDPNLKRVMRGDVNVAVRALEFYLRGVA